jgi:hypothetical protein
LGPTASLRSCRRWPGRNRTFNGIFYDKGGKQVSVYEGLRESVPAKKTVHFRIHVYPALPATAVRFDVIPTCHD